MLSSRVLILSTIVVLPLLMQCKGCAQPTEEQLEVQSNASGAAGAALNAEIFSQEAFDNATDLKAEALVLRIECEDAGATTAQLAFGDSLMATGDSELDGGNRGRQLGSGPLFIGTNRFDEGNAAWNMELYSIACTYGYTMCLPSLADADSCYNASIDYFNSAGSSYEDAVYEFAGLLGTLYGGSGY